MADTVRFLLPIDPTIASETLKEWNYPFRVGRHGTQKDLYTQQEAGDLVPRVFPEWKTIKGPHASFRARARLDQHDAYRLVGYDVEANVPTVSVGHNLLICNSVSNAVEIAVLLFKIHLLDHVRHPGAIYALDLEKVELTFVEVTDCYEHESIEALNETRRGFEALTELKNESEHRRARLGKSQAFGVGPSTNKTIYLKDRDTVQKGYVKDRTAPSVAEFPTEELRNQLHDRAERLFRHEHGHHGAALHRYGLSTVEAWRRYGTEKAYESVRDVALKKLGIYEELRTRRPTADVISRLPAPDRSMVEMHLEGENARQHPEVLKYATKIKQSKYFSAVKRRVFERTKIDLAIPWAKQSAVASSSIRQRFDKSNLAHVPEDLAPYCFTGGVAAEIVRNLKLDVARRTNDLARRTGNTSFIRELEAVDVGPPEWNPRLWESWQRMTVHSGVAEALKKFGKPLHPMLELHAFGCFGDVTLKEIEANHRAMESLRPVSSLFNIGSNRIRVTTNYHADEAGELRPWIDVTVEERPVSGIQLSTAL